MTYHDRPYLQLMHQIFSNGASKQDRTNTGIISTFASDMRFDLSDGTIPLLTTKKMHWPAIIHELLWYISGSTNNNDLERNGVRIWREWADDTGDLGPLYGAQLRNWNGEIDQLQEIIDLLRNDPDSRRMVVSYWNPSLLPDSSIPPKQNPPRGKQSLPPCHYTWQVYTTPIDNNRRMSLKLTQRSADVFLGVPFNIVQYSILLRMLCHITGYLPGEFIWSGGDTHIYSNHIEQCNTQLSRTPRASPTLVFRRPITSIDDFVFEDFILTNYDPYPAIKAQVAV